MINNIIESFGYLMSTSNPEQDISKAVTTLSDKI